MLRDKVIDIFIKADDFCNEFEVCRFKSQMQSLSKRHIQISDVAKPVLQIGLEYRLIFNCPHFPSPS